MHGNSKEETTVTHDSWQSAALSSGWYYLGCYCNFMFGVIDSELPLFLRE